MERKGWLALPVLLLVGVAAQLGLNVWDLVRALQDHSPIGGSVREALAEGGVWVAAVALVAAGLDELALPLTGSARRLVRTAAVVVASLVIVETAWQWVWPHLHGESQIATADKIYAWMWYALRIGPPLLLVGATWHVRRTLAIAALIAVVVANLPPPVAKAAYSWLVTGFPSSRFVQALLHGITIVATVALATAHVRVTPPEEPVRAAAGMRRIASALWLRVVAICVLLGLTLIVAMGRGDDSSISTLKFAMISSAAITIVSLLLLSLGVLAAIRAQVVELPRMTLVLSGILLLWCLGVLLTQLPYLYQVLYAGGDDYGGFGRSNQDMVSALATVVPVCATLGVALIAAAIAQFARERSDEALREEAAGKGVGFVALMLVSVAIPAWFLPKAESTSSLFLMSLLAIVAGIWATVLMARLCNQASLAIEREPGLPAATIVNAP